MPGYKHPCPYCAKFIDSGVAACPFCGVMEPFTGGRCPDCRAPLQPEWIACPKCGRALNAADTTTSGPTASTVTPPASAPSSTPATALDPTPTPLAPTAATGPGRCSGCGSALPAGARFCAECGTLAG